MADDGGAMLQEVRQTSAVDDMMQDERYSVLSKSQAASGSVSTSTTRRAKMSRVKTLADNTKHNEGLCLLFKRQTKYHELKIEGQKLSLHRQPELTANEAEKAARVHSDWPHRKNILKNLPKAGIRYNLTYSKDENKTYVIAVIAMTHNKAEEWAQIHGYDCMVEPRQAILIGRNKEDFLLAHRTCLEDGQDPVEFTDPGLRMKNVTFPKLPLHYWDYIHITYEKSLQRELYKRFPPHNHLLDNRLYLNILYDALQASKGVGGANFAFHKFIRDRNHPLIDIFAIDILLYDKDEQKYKSSKPVLTARDMWLPQTQEFWDTKVDQIRNHYGESVAFYFAFLRHYITWSYSITIFGVLWFIAQLSVGEIAVPGSSGGVGIALLWATFMTEAWYRKEKWLRYKWGMVRYKATEAPRAGFQGKLAVSKTTGDLVETHMSVLWHYVRILFSMSTVFMCLAGVIGVVFVIWSLRRLWRRDQSLTYAIAFINAFQIQLMNRLYTVVAKLLNEFEQHRLEQDYYNHLVTKRIFFFIVNSYNSLFYIAFYRSDYDNDEQRLEAIRLQLIILFVTLTIGQNLIEIFLPIIKACVKRNIVSMTTRRLDAREESRASRQNSQGKKMGAFKSALDVGADAGDAAEEDDSFEALVVTREMWEDIEGQIPLPVAPDVLSNTAEIVIQFGYVMLFVFIFPLMPLLGLFNNFLEARIDFENLVYSRRAIPFASSGIGVWKTVLSVVVLGSVFTNMTLITYRTDAVTNFVGSVTDEKNVALDDGRVLTWYFVVCLVCVFLQFVIRFMVSDTNKLTKQSLARQTEVEKHLLLAAGISAEDVRLKHMHKAWEDDPESEDDEDESSNFGPDKDYDDDDDDDAQNNGKGGEKLLSNFNAPPPKQTIRVESASEMTATDTNKKVETDLVGLPDTEEDAVDAADAADGKKKDEALPGEDMVAVMEETEKEDRVQKANAETSPVPPDTPNVVEDENDLNQLPANDVDDDAPDAPDAANEENDANDAADGADAGNAGNDGNDTNDANDANDADNAGNDAVVLNIDNEAGKE